MLPQSSLSEEVLMANGMALCTKRNKNVSASDMKQGRWPNGEAAVQKQKKAQRKDDNKKQQERNLCKVAQIEHQIANKENNAVLTMPVCSKVAQSTVIHPSLSSNYYVPDSEEKHERQREKRKEKCKAHIFIDREHAILDVGNAPSKLKCKADRAIAEFDSFLPSAKKLKPCKNAPDSDRKPMEGISDDEDIATESLAKVDLSPVIPVPKVSACQQYTLKKKITHSDIPHGIRHQFHNKYVPYAIRMAGHKKAWYTPNYEDAINAWNSMKEAAVKALDKLLKNEGKKTIEEKAQYVKWLEGKGLGDNKPLFYYKIVNEHDNRKHPGALVMAVQVMLKVKCALFYYQNSIKEEPNSRDPLSRFLHANWADCEETHVNKWGDTVKKIVPLTSFILVLTKKLKGWQWKKIHKESLQSLSKGPSKSPFPASSCQYNEDPELVDDDNNFQDISSKSKQDSHSTELVAHISDDNIEEMPDCDNNHSNLPGDNILQEYSQGTQDDLLNFNDGNVYMKSEDDDKESITESDTEMPSVACPQVKWVGYYSDSKLESN
ncbi:hypothetical protein BDN71DRAFT_1431581 [Pleurotus eryngii]|uniref:Uncharacterized protein n=1 Tax=Pleurotus eryngii TaxID=5323 RepID=A0A9P5ZWW4_PLEER|nr:hypothetical protein BDN71DRAFT_1431581 [Pleurotus eryngii]